MNSYEKNIENYVKNIPNHSYMFEVTKCCGYSQFVSVYKYGSLSLLFDSISYVFGNKDPISIFVYNIESGDYLEVPNTNDIILKQFILDNQQLFKPIYPLPHQVVYKIFYEDRHCKSIENLDNNMMVLADQENVNDLTCHCTSEYSNLFKEHNKNRHNILH